jgi:hypothetical protein
MGDGNQDKAGNKQYQNPINEHKRGQVCNLLPPSLD